MEDSLPQSVQLLLWNIVCTFAHATIWPFPNLTLATSSPRASDTVSGSNVYAFNTLFSFIIYNLRLRGALGGFPIQPLFLTPRAVQKCADQSWDWNSSTVYLHLTFWSIQGFFYGLWMW